MIISSGKDNRWIRYWSISLWTRGDSQAAGQILQTVQQCGWLQICLPQGKFLMKWWTHHQNQKKKNKMYSMNE